MLIQYIKLKSLTQNKFKLQQVTIHATQNKVQVLKYNSLIITVAYTNMQVLNNFKSNCNFKTTQTKANTK